MKKKVLSFVLVLCLIAACLPLSAGAAGPLTRAEMAEIFATYLNLSYDSTKINPFTDVVAGDTVTQKQYEAILACAQKGYVSGTGDGLFDPAGVVYRAQLAVLIYRTAGDSASDTSGLPEDVEAGQWYTDPVAYVLEQGVMTIASDGLFHPNDPAYESHLNLTALEKVFKPVAEEPAAPVVDPVAEDPALAAAKYLYGLGLFVGTGTDADGNPIFELERVAMRSEGIAMLVRLLGKEQEGQTGSWTTPFNDVPNWAKPYVGYAYTNKLTYGTGAKTFGSKMDTTVNQYLSFVLRALGYEDGTDFTWRTAVTLSDSIGLTHGEYEGTESITRGEIAIISMDALSQKKKDGDRTLLQILIDQGAVKQ